MDLLAWDAYLDSETEGTSESRRAMLSSMVDAVDGRARIEEIHEMNFLMKGQKRPKVGSILGFRLILGTDQMTEQEIEDLVQSLSSTNLECSEKATTVSPMMVLDTPAFLDQIEMMPASGQLTLNVRFAKGFESRSTKEFDQIKKNETKDTKNMLDISKPQFMKKYINGGLSDSGVLSTPFWYLVKDYNEEEKEVVKGGSAGGSYQISYDLNPIIDGLLEASKGEWWDSIEDDAALFPRVVVDCNKKKLEGAVENPMNWFHHRKEFRDKRVEGDASVEGVLGPIEWAKLRHGSTDDLEDIEYAINKIFDSTPPRIEITNTQGLVLGQEHIMVRELVLRPWITREFCNLLHAFLLTAAPRYWLHGKSEIRILHPQSSITPLR